MKYEIGDKVEYKNVIFIMKAKILEIDKDSEYKYHIEYEDYEGQIFDVWVKEEDLVGFSKRSKKHLKQELYKLLKSYSKEEILEVL